MTVLYLGSGGGGGYNNGIDQNESGGNGGGVIAIECNGDVILQDKALICANGSDSVFGGGGSGGSIKISCANLLSKSEYIMDDLGNYECIVSAVGGRNKDGGCAGDGRIRISAQEVDVKMECIDPEPHVDNDYIGDFVE